MFKKGTFETESKVLLRNKTIVWIDELRDRDRDTPSVSDKIFFQKQTGINVLTSSIGDFFDNDNGAFKDHEKLNFYPLFQKYLSKAFYLESWNSKNYKNNLYSFFMFMLTNESNFNYRLDHEEMFDRIFLENVHNKNILFKELVNYNSFILNLYGLFVWTIPYIGQHLNFVNVDYLFTLMILTKLFMKSAIDRYTFKENVGKVVLTLNQTKDLQNSIIILIYNIEDELKNELMNNFYEFYKFKNSIAEDYELSDVNIAIQIETKSSQQYKFTL